MDAADLKLGQRVYNKNGKLMAIDLNRQVDILNRQDAAMWPTIRVKQAEDCPSERNRRSPSLDSMAKLHGQAAPANPSTDGSRQGLWATPQASDYVEGARTELTSNQKCLGRDMKQWATPIMGDSHLASTPEVAQKRIEEGKVTLSRQMAAQWATPRSGKTTDENPETWAARQSKGDVATMPLTAQVKCWPTICAGDYRTPPTNSGISGQTIMPSSEHALPKAAGGKLNPRWVETLMGLPIGWVMPSCKSPVTIEPTNFDSSETESCQPQPSELFEF
jgi:hypothetical protein